MRRLKALLKENTEILALSDVAGRLASLQKIWESIVPPPLLPHTRTGGVKHRRITIFADNGAVAAKIKLLAPGLLKNLQNKGVDVTSIRVEVQVVSRARRPLRQVPTISKEAAASLEQLAQKLPETSLAMALRRLAKHAKEI